MSGGREAHRDDTLRDVGEVEVEPVLLVTERGINEIDDKRSVDVEYGDGKAPSPSLVLRNELPRARFQVLLLGDQSDEADGSDHTDYHEEPARLTDHNDANR